MSEENDSNWINNRVIYTLSFILVLWELRSFILSWFPQGFIIKLLGKNITPEIILSSMLLILLISLYLYAFNYLLRNPLNKIKLYFNWLASFIWTVSLLFPILIIIILIIQAMIQDIEFLTSLIFLIFGIFCGFLSSWYQRRNREIELMYLNNGIEILKLEPLKEDKTSKFLRYILILESLIKFILVEKVKISIGHDKSINLVTASNILYSKGIITIKTRNKLLILWNIRNNIIHQNNKPTEADIQKVKEIIKSLELETKVDKGLR